MQLTASWGYRPSSIDPGICHSPFIFKRCFAVTAWVTALLLLLLLTATVLEPEVRTHGW